VSVVEWGQLQPQDDGAWVSSSAGAPQQALFALGSQQLLSISGSQQPDATGAVLMAPVVVSVVVSVMVSVVVVMGPPSVVSGAF